MTNNNNELEANNLTIKKELMREQPGLTTLLPQAAEWLKQCSVNDDSFGLTHNRKVSFCCQKLMAARATESARTRVPDPHSGLWIH